ncbi:MAG: hypothetical protein WDZ91_14040 [Paenibacillaceae bacterium]
MGVNRDELKRMIDRIPEQEAVEVLDFIGFLEMKREREALHQLDVEVLSVDEDLIRQVQKSREDREGGHIFCQETGLEYLRSKVEENERGQNL